jgi:hypothetical protein
MRQAQRSNVGVNIDQVPVLDGRNWMCLANGDSRFVLISESHHFPGRYHCEARDLAENTMRCSSNPLEAREMARFIPYFFETEGLIRTTLWKETRALPPDSPCRDDSARTEQPNSFNVLEVPWQRGAYPSGELCAEVSGSGEVEWIEIPDA